jgi:hypothetical protein
MLEFFANPTFLAAGGAMVSAPVIIHLINRMRFKRLRWAAMEFLLKSQKRNRRRLIIEQLILLALRCLLVLLASLLVMRYVSTTLAGPVSQKSLHVVVLDDTLSMADQWKEGNEVKTCFKVAKETVLPNLFKALGEAGPNDRLAIIPLSKLVTEDNFEPPIFYPLNDEATAKALGEFLKPLQPTTLHVPLLRGVERARQLFGDNADSQPVLHLVSDFRVVDWTGAESGPLVKVLQDLHNSKVKIHPTDTAHPYRVKGQRGVPLSHDNVAIVDFHPNSRVVGVGMPVTFSVTVANYGARDESVNIVIYNDNTGKAMEEVGQLFDPPMPLKVPAEGSATATFELREYPTLKPGELFHSKRLTARLETAQRVALENDGLAADNVRHAAVEIRQSVPVLVIDGNNAKGREENGDSFFIKNAIISVPGGTYEVVYGDDPKLGAGNSAKALERDDLSQYPAIFLLDVPELTEKQRKNLEKYVSEGGGVGFFLGPHVSAKYYNKDLYRKGDGFFPVPLRETYTPPPNEEPRQTPFTGSPQLLVRDDQFSDSPEGLKRVPIFGEIFKEPAQLAVFTQLPVQRYFAVQRSDWTKVPGRTFELATLPNDLPATTYSDAALEIVKKLPLTKKEYEFYRPALQRYADAIRATVEPGAEHKAHRLGEVLKGLLRDQGKLVDKGKYDPQYPPLTKFWDSPAPEIRDTLKKEVEALRESAQFGDPFVVAQTYGKGHVVAVMSTAGKEWNEWGGGSLASSVYPLFVWRMQNYLSSQGAAANLTVGTPVTLQVNAANFRQLGKHRLRTVRTYYKPQLGQPADAQKEQDANYGSEENGIQTFSYLKTFEPGPYLTMLFDQADPEGRSPLAAWGHVFNVDAQHEGRLRRISNDDFARTLDIADMPIHGPVATDEIVDRRNELSESAWFFLFFLLVLVTEQALAVHLSYHLRSGEGEMSPAAPQPQARAA